MISTRTPDAAFQALLGISAQARGYARRSAEAFGDPGVNVCWSLWVDPGTHTGLAAAVYVPPAEGMDSRYLARTFWNSFDRAGMGQEWLKAATIEGRELEAGRPDITGAALLGLHTELLEGDERQQVATVMGRIRRLGKQWARTATWEPETAGLGNAGIGAETFIIMKPDRSADYPSPLRIRSMLAYALWDEFGIDMLGEMPGEAKNAFDDLRMKRQGLYVPGPQHERDALAHLLLSIRKRG